MLGVRGAGAASKSTRTFSDFESVADAMNGICQLYEQRLKQMNPGLSLFPAPGHCAVPFSVGGIPRLAGMRGPVTVITAVHSSLHAGRRVLVFLFLECWEAAHCASNTLSRCGLGEQETLNGIGRRSGASDKS